ncbi:uncharacterized protein PRCAT00002218001 [Priceomyces carsonii]|uniref:uncharacterized protein n=1 Tax=Priceomyces carsonii TaxID=28549 RepID=UPI002ED8F93C|nr:unnamed protein product [Priceomyces carsonii]
MHKMIQIKSLDYIVLTVAPIVRFCKVYSEVLGMEVQKFNPPSNPSQVRYALKFGNSKINLHEKGKELEPYAQNPIPGSADICFILESEELPVKSLEEVIMFLKEKGPVPMTGANGRMSGVYIRDPDSNLLEIAKYL